MRVLSLGLLLISTLCALSINNTPGTQNQHSRVWVNNLFSDSAIYGPEVSQEDTPIDTGVLNPLIPPDILSLAAPVQKEESGVVQAASNGGVTTVAFTGSTTPTIRPITDSGGQTQPVRITFYYCQKTVERIDDGGGFCFGTAYAGLVHPGTAACPSEWHGRKFTIVNNTLDQLYTCEDTGSAVNGYHVDIWFATNGEGWSWPMHGQGSIVWQD